MGDHSGMSELPGHGAKAAGDGPAAAAYEQAKAAARDTLRNHDGSFLLILERDEGIRLTGSFRGHIVAGPGGPDDDLFDLCAIEFLDDALEAVIDTIGHYTAALARRRKGD